MPGWSCSRSGDCCEQVGEVVCTHAERAAIERACHPTLHAVLSWRPHEDSRFVRLSAHPCPLLTRDADGKAVCSVYESRPFRCRAWGCFRPSPEREVFESEVNVIGCANLRERLQQSAVVRREFKKLHAKAQEWGRQMGWGES
jgi:Fe-S-cluster containining protein